MITNKKTKLFFILSFVMLGLLMIGKNIIAQESTPSSILGTGSSADDPSEKVIQKIKDRLDKDSENLQAEVKAAQIRTKLYFGYFGDLVEVTDNQLTIDSLDDKQIVVFDESTAVSQTKSGVKTLVDHNQLSDYISSFMLAIGQKNEDNSLRAEKISFFTKPEPIEQRLIVFGLIIEAESQNIKVDWQGVESEVLVTGKTKIMREDGSTIQTEDILIDDRVVCICAESNSQLSAKKILVMPGDNNPLAIENQINATESANATDSAETEEKIPF